MLIEWQEFYKRNPTLAIVTVRCKGRLPIITPLLRDLFPDPKFDLWQTCSRIGLNVS